MTEMTEHPAVSEELRTIVREITEYYSEIDANAMNVMAELIQKANRIFVAGAGRSGFAARAFSNRLMHLGFQVCFVGEPTTPAIQKGDLLIAGSGSGTTASLVAMSQKARAAGAYLGTVTIFPQNTIGRMADVTVAIPGATPKGSKDNTDTAISVQPMGSLFEQLSWLVYDAIVMLLQKKTGQTDDEMFARHANLE